MPASAEGYSQEALLYEKQAGKRVLCNLCPHRCVIEDGKYGACKVRQNRGGSLYALTYGHPIVQNVDVVEKKPLYHFFPGSNAYSIGTYGCNLHCGYCINWEIAQPRIEQLELCQAHTAPKEILESVREAGCKSIAYTYVEPTIFFEYMYAIASTASAVGILNVMKTNGFMTEEVLDLCKNYLDAANVDLKAFRDDTYRQLGGRLQPVLNTLQQFRRLNIWVEISTVVIPGVNDDMGEIGEMASFIFRELGPDTPWHITRFFPAHRMTSVPPTPIATLERARDVGRDVGLNYIYVDHLLGQGRQDTVCAKCGTTLIQRRGFHLEETIMSGDACPVCGAAIPGVWQNSPKVTTR